MSGDSGLPAGWIEAPLGALGTWMGGSTPSKSNEAYWRHGTVPWVTPKDMKTDIVQQAQDLISAEAVRNSRLRLVPPDSLLMVVRSGILSHTLPVARNSVAVALNQDMKALVLDGSVHADYLRYTLQRAATAVLRQCGKHGTTVASLEASALNRFVVPVAPLAEQRRIADKLDELLSQVAAGEAALERVRANLARYRAAVLKAAVEGRLTADWRATHPTPEPATDLLARILADRRAQWEATQLATYQARGQHPPTNWRAKYKPPTPPDPTNLPTLPEGWCWASVEQLAEIVSGKTPKGVDEVLRPDGAIPWFRVSDMNTPGNERTMQSWEQGLSRETASALGLQPQPGGTIIFPKRGGAIATNKRRQLAAPSCYDLNTMGFVPSNGMGRYLWHWFGTVDLRSLSDGSNVPQINHGDIMPLLVPLAPEPEQAAICDEVDRLLDVFGHAELLVKASTARAARLRQSILKHAFEGKLVPQDPTDEPADALLARIATERRAAAPKARPRRGRGDQP